MTKGLSKLTRISPMASPANAPELSANAIGTWVGRTTAGPPKKVVAVGRL